VIRTGKNVEKTAAIIDLGTNTFHLLIARWSERGFQILHREREAVKIGMGGINEGIITEAGANRAVKALESFRETLAKWSLEKTLGIGTSALRNAKNGARIARRLEQASGIPIRIISGDEEATYIYHGVRLAMDIGNIPSLIVDIGGGSVEFIIADQQTLLWKRSFEIGAQRLLERFQKHEPMLPEEMAILLDFFSTDLKPLAEAMTMFNPRVLIGSSGTFDTLSEIYCLRNSLPYSGEATETPLTQKGFNEIFSELVKKDRQQRLEINGMIEMRVDMIVVASCLVYFLLHRHPFEAIRVSTYSLKEGVLATLIRDSRAGA
jgi:exopolyphosphatase / guanosine-5'-triphosphate,3'-diphosphate pyrophosphatase